MFAPEFQFRTKNAENEMKEGKKKRSCWAIQLVDFSLFRVKPCFSAQRKLLQQHDVSGHILSELFFNLFNVCSALCSPFRKYKLSNKHEKITDPLAASISTVRKIIEIGWHRKRLL